MFVLAKRSKRSRKAGKTASSSSPVFVPQAPLQGAIGHGQAAGDVFAARLTQVQAVAERLERPVRLVSALLLGGFALWQWAGLFGH